MKDAEKFEKELEDMVKYVFGEEDFKPLVEILKNLSEAGEHEDNLNLNISQLKKRIKYCRNPLEKQSLQRELNTLYKKRKRGLNYENTLWKDEKHFCKIGQQVRS